MKTVRIATVTATGRRYLVQAVDFKNEVVHCWGDVTRQRGAASTHGPSRKFRLSAVKIADAVKDQWLVNELFEEHMAALVAEGKAVPVGRKGNYRMVGRLLNATEQAYADEAQIALGKVGV